jgi:hypothetical protein
MVVQGTVHMYTVCYAYTLSWRAEAESGQGRRLLQHCTLLTTEILLGRKIRKESIYLRVPDKQILAPSESYIEP